MAGIHAIYPGKPISEIARSTNAALVRAGLAPLDSGRIGHGLGLQSTEPPDIDTSSQVILAPGIVITLEPAVIREDGIFQVEQVVVVRDGGYEILSHSPPELRHL
jgi:Xaa-Pro aminopeptidase